MKFIIFVLAYFFAFNASGQNFPNSSFTHNSVSYSVLATSMRAIISNNGNPQITRTKPLERTRKINYDKLKIDIVASIKLIVTPQQLITLEQERGGVSISFYVDNTGKISIVKYFNINNQTCLLPSNIYDVEIAIKNIIVQFQDGLSPEVGALSVIIPAKMFR